MILGLSSTLPTFKTLEFKPGLNVLLSNTAAPKSRGKTRNSAGKSSSVMIVDFLLGASVANNSLFKSDALAEHEFTGRFLISGQEITVSRSGAQPNEIYVASDRGLPAGIAATQDNANRHCITNAVWQKYLGNAWFALPFGESSEPSGQKYAPTYRSMIKYFTRLKADGGFIDPERNAERQQPYSYQACLSYMFGLGWNIAQDFQRLRDRKKELQAIERNARKREKSGASEGIDKIRAKLVLLEQDVHAKRNEVSNFEVMATYRETAERAAALKLEMQEISQKIVSLEETLAFYRKAQEDEKPSYSVDLEEIYQLGGVPVSDVALRRFEEVAAFQKSVTENRESHLRAEIEGAERSLIAAREELDKAGKERQELLLLLEGKGAFEDLASLQKDLASLEVEYASLKNQYEVAQLRVQEKDEQQVEQVDLLRRLRSDHYTHRRIIDDLTVRVSELIRRLYSDRNGYLTVNAKENGPEFVISIDGDRGTGIRSMEIFCMSVVLFECVRRRTGGPHFMIHDSHLFDGVDQRQISAALEIGREMAAQESQYIVTMNSDVFDGLRDSEGADFSGHVLDTQLSDMTEDGGLFGLRFE